MIKPRAVAWFAVVAVVSAAAGYAFYPWSRGGGADPAQAANPKAVAEAVFAARLADPQGGTRTLGEWRGRVLVVNFWATWCAPCFSFFWRAWLTAGAQQESNPQTALILQGFQPVLPITSSNFWTTHINLR